MGTTYSQYGNSFNQQSGAVPEGNINGYQPGNFLE